MTEYMKGGKVRRWLDSQGYGFIKRDSGGHDLFLHRQQVIASGVDPYDINENVRVYFDIGRDKNGRDVAINIAAVTSHSSAGGRVAARRRCFIQIEALVGCTPCQEMDEARWR